MLIYEKIPKIIKDIEAVKKKKSEEQGYGTVSYAYRRIDDFMNALNPLLGENGVTLVPEVLEVKRSVIETSKGGKMNTVEIKAKYTLFATDGSFIQGVTIGEGFDSGDKASGKAQSNALKYFIMPTFMVPTDDIDDTDGHDHGDMIANKQPLKTNAIRPPLNQKPQQVQKPSPAIKTQPEPIKDPPPLNTAEKIDAEYVFNFGTKYLGKKISEVSEGDLHQIRIGLLNLEKLTPEQEQGFKEINKRLGLK